MKIGIIDADLIGRDKHNFPNLVCEKISGYWKENGAEVTLLMNYDDLESYDRVYIAKVFTDTFVPDFIHNIVLGCPDENHRHIFVGGTGFYFDKAPNLPDEIEHHMPDYHLYDDWIVQKKMVAIEKSKKEGKPFNERNFRNKYKDYTDCSIGFLTRGCFRKCKFCVNQKFDHVFQHSPLKEFHDPSRSKIILLDDNFFGCQNWKSLLNELIEIGKPFTFKQGLDERLLTEEKCEMIFNANYYGDIFFAFDNISDYELIQEKLKMIRKYAPDKKVKVYVLVGFLSTDAVDIENAFRRIELLLKYRCVPYIMRYISGDNVAYWETSKYRGVYIALAGWCNQVNVITKLSFREFCYRKQELHKTEGTYCSVMQALVDFEKENPEIAERYFDIRFGGNEK